MSQATLKDASPEELEAFVQVVVLVAYADGDLSPAEETVLVSNVQRLTGGRVEDDRMQALMTELPPLSRSSNNWRRDRIAELKKNLGNEELRKEAFRIAVDVAKSDNKIGLREGRMLVNIVDELGIDSDYATRIISGKEA